MAPGVPDIICTGIQQNKHQTHVRHSTALGRAGEEPPGGYKPSTGLATTQDWQVLNDNRGS